jgi:hypothetical protein
MKIDKKNIHKLHIMYADFCMAVKQEKLQGNGKSFSCLNIISQETPVNSMLKTP